MNILSLLILSPFIGAAIILFIPGVHERIIKVISGIFISVSFIIGVSMLLAFDASSSAAQFTQSAEWIRQFGIRYYVGVDGISLLMVLLTGFLGTVSFILSLSIKERVKEYFILFLVEMGAIFGVFASLDIFLFLVFLQITLVPVFLIIGIWGGEGRVSASRDYLIYNFTASICLLVAIIGIFSTVETGDLSMLNLAAAASDIPVNYRIVILVLLAVGFGTISGIFPFHSWVEDVCYQAPSQLSMIMAGVWLKIGIFGMVRFILPIMSSGKGYMESGIFSVMGVVTLIYGALLLIGQKDIRRLISCSVIVYGGYFVLAFGSFNAAGITGLVFSMVSHGLVIASLYILTDIIHRRTGRRLISDFGDLSKSAPVFTIFSVVLLLCIAGIPGFSSFVGIFFTFLGIFKSNPLIAAAAFIGFVIAAGVFLRMLQEVFFMQDGGRGRSMSDLTVKEIFLLLPFAALVLILGVYPQAMLNIFNQTVISLAVLLKG